MDTSSPGGLRPSESAPPPSCSSSFFSTSPRATFSESPVYNIASKTSRSSLLMSKLFPTSSPFAAASTPTEPPPMFVLGGGGGGRDEEEEEEEGTKRGGGQHGRRDSSLSSPALRPAQQQPSGPSSPLITAASRVYGSLQRHASLLGTKMLSSYKSGSPTSAQDDQGNEERKEEEEHEDEDEDYEVPARPFFGVDDDFHQTSRSFSTKRQRTWL